MAELLRLAEVGWAGGPCAVSKEEKYGIPDSQRYILVPASARLSHDWILIFGLKLLLQLQWWGALTVSRLSCLNSSLHPPEGPGCQ